MMNIAIPDESIRAVKPGDADWMLRSGLVVTPRAGVELSDDCPYEYKLVIAKCFTNGWIKPIAHVYDHEIMWDHLTEKE